MNFVKGEIVSDEEERSMEPQAEEDVCNSDGLRNRKMKSSRPEEDAGCPSELGNGEEKSFGSGKELDGGVKRSLLPFSTAKVCWVMIREVLAARFAWDGMCLVLFLFVGLCSRSFSGELYVNQHEHSKDLHQNISEMRIVETPLHSVRSVARNGKWVFKLSRHDFLLLRTAGDKWYKAEKHGSNSGQPGIHFYPVTEPGAETIRFRSNISVDFSLAQALAILTSHELDFSLWRENCWKYAHSRAKAILNSCIEIASDDNVRNELKKVLENLMDARRRMPNEVVDIVQDWNILWVVLVCFAGVFFRFLLGFFLGFGKNLERGPSFLYELGAFYSMLFVLEFMGYPNPMFLTYDLTWLATTYRWHFNFLSFFGYYVGWTVFVRGLDSCVVELEKHSEDPDWVGVVQCLRTAVSGRMDLYISNFRTNYHQEEDRRKQWSPRNVLFGLVILNFVMTFEKTLGYSISIACLRFLVCSGLLATKRLFMANRREDDQIQLGALIESTQCTLHLIEAISSWMLRY